MFAPFLSQLTEETDLQVTLRDWQRVCVALRAAGATRDLGLVRQVMACVLASTPEQRSQFNRQFDRFFSSADTTDVDVEAALQDLRRLLQMPAPPEVVPSRTKRAAKSTPAATTSPPPVATERVAEPLIPFQLIDEVDIIPDEEDELVLRDWADSIPPKEHTDQGWSYFHWGLVCPRPEPLITPGELDEAADSLGFYRSDTLSRWLDVPATIDATIDQGGLPTLRMQQHRKLFALTLLIDEHSRALSWNSAPEELLHGMRLRGVTARPYYFYGALDSLQDEQGRSLTLEDLEDERQSSITLIVSDGRGMYQRRSRRALERMARWPRVAWLDPGDPAQWERTSDYCRWRKRVRYRRRSAWGWPTGCGVSSIPSCPPRRSTVC